MKLLIIEDDKDILSFLTKGFKELGYTIDSALDGTDGEYLALTNSYDIIILDWMLPSKNGIEILSNLRKQNINTPIIMLTAKDTTLDKIQGLKNGADDYIGKPFSFDELEARIEALYRRTYLSTKSNIISFNNISIDIDKKIVLKNNKKLELSAKEYELLIFLLTNKNSYVGKSMIEEYLWNNEEFISSNVIEVTIYNLRKKLGKDIIKSFRGLGYKIEI